MRPFERLHAHALRDLTNDRHAALGFGARGERTCCDGKCLQRHGICPAQRKPLHLAPGVIQYMPRRTLLQRLRAWWRRHIVDHSVWE